MRRLRQFRSLFFLCISIIMVVSFIFAFVVPPASNKYPDVFFFSMHTSEFRLGLITAFCFGCVVGILIFTIYDIFQKRRRKHSSSSFSVMVEIDGKKVFLETTSLMEARGLLTRFNALNPTIYQRGAPLTQRVGKQIEKEQTSTSSNT